MTPEKLQIELINELSHLFSDVEFRDEKNEVVPMKIFPQALPIRESEDEAEPLPWCIVKLAGNEVKNPLDMEQTQDVQLWFGIFYDNPDCQYQHLMLTIFEKVKRRFLTDPILSEFFAKPNIVSVMDDKDEKGENTYPYYFGAMSLEFLMPNYEGEDEYS